MQRKRISLGQALSGTGAVLAENKRLFIVYLAVFVPLVALGNYFDRDTGGNILNYDNGTLGLFILLLSVIAQFYIFERVVLVGSETTPNRAARVAGFVGLAILTFLATSIASIFLLLPGLFVGARLLMSPAIYASKDEGVIAAMRESWDSTRGSTLQISLALLLLVVGMSVIGSVGGTMSFSLNSQTYTSGLDLADSRHLLSAITTEILTVALIALSIATFQNLADRTDTLQDIFE